MVYLHTRFLENGCDLGRMYTVVSEYPVSVKADIQDAHAMTQELKQLDSWKEVCRCCYEFRVALPLRTF